MSDLYSTLGVDKTASDQEIKKAFKQKAHEHHPDKSGDEEKFKEVQKAYAILKDSEKREHYDRTGETKVPDEGGLARRDIVQAFVELFKKNGLKRKNYVPEVKKIFKKRLRELDDSRKKAKDILEKLQYLVDHTKGDELTMELLKGQLDEITRDLVKIEQIEKIQTKALDLLDGFSYNGEEAEGSQKSDFEAMCARATGGFGSW